MPHAVSKNKQTLLGMNEGMEGYWTKKRIALLTAAEPQAIQTWLEQYVNVIYTWLYFQVASDSDTTVDLTIRTFTRALEQIEQFQPAQQTMFQWLRACAKQALDEGLQQWQTKRQRPWAWSQLPADVLSGLSTLRNEVLSDEAVSNPAVQEMVQATLAEMEETDRALMMHRYNHLDTPEHITEEVGLSIEQVDDRLYRCRHFFRRALIQLVQSENLGFNEASATGTLERLDSNLEKLLSSTAMYRPISDNHLAIINKALTRAVLNVAQTRNAASGNHSRRRILIIAAAVLLVLGCIGFLYPILLDEPEQAQTPDSPKQDQDNTAMPDTAKASPNAPEDDTEQIDQDQLRLRRVFEMGQVGDLAGLLQILKDGQFTSQLAAAHFIGNLGDESAIGLLEESEAKWYPNGPDDNPFAEAIIQIQNRQLTNTVVEVVEQTEPNEQPDTTAIESVEQPTLPAAPPAIAGTVTDFEGQPIPNARVTLAGNPLYAEVADMRILQEAQTDQQGNYQFVKIPDGPVFLICQSAGDNSMSITRSLWYKKEKPVQVNFGGPRTIFGTLNLTPLPSSNQILYLSDTLDPSEASFRSETITSADGHFTFVGIPAGTYYLLNNTESNRIVWISSLEVAGEDIPDWQVDVSQAAITIQLEQPENAPAVTRAMLTYGIDVSGELQQFALQPQEDGTYTGNVPLGSYTLIMRFENGMRLQQQVEINQDRQLAVTVPEGSSDLSGQFSGKSPLAFFLYNTDQRIRFDLLPDADGFYSLTSVPPDVYSLAILVNNLKLDLMEIDLLNEPEQVLDIAPLQLVADYSPLYVVVTDAQNLLVEGARVWVTGDAEVITTESTGRGAFLAVPPGEYSLFAALPGSETQEKVIQVQATPFLTKPNTENTILIKLGP